MMPDQIKSEPDVFGKLKPLLGKRIDIKYRQWLAGNQREKAEIVQGLEVIAATLQDKRIGNRKIYIEPPPPDVIGRGDYEIGKVIFPGKTPYPFRIYRNELIQHALFDGPAGKGKTSLIMNITEQVHADGIPWMALDGKGSFRVMRRAVNGEDVIVLTTGSDVAPLRINMLLPPPRVSTMAWLENVADTLCAAWSLLDGARSKLIEVFLDAVDQHGERATLRDAFDLLKRDFGTVESWRKRGQGWMESTERAFKMLTRPPFGDCLCERDNPMLVGELLQQQVVIELKGLGEAQATTVSVFFLQATLLTRQHQTGPREVLRHVMICDESQNIFRPQPSWEKPNFPNRLIAESREFGQCVLAGTQGIGVSEQLLINTGTKAVLGVGGKWDLEHFSKAFQLNPADLTIIPTGQGIGKIPQRWHKPFLFSFPKNKLKNLDVSDEEVAARYAAYRTGKSTTTSEPEPVTVVTDNELRLLTSIATNPLLSITQHYDALDVRPKTGNSAKERLLRHQLIQLDTVQYGSITKKFARLTPQGVRLMIDKGITITSIGGRSAEHEHWKHELKNILEAHHYTVTLEHSIGERRHVDLHAKNNERELLIEVETGKSDVAANISKCSNLGTLILFFTSTHAFQTHERIIPRSTIALTPHTIDFLPLLLK